MLAPLCVVLTLPSARAQEPQFDVAVTRVRVDLIVTGEDGRFVDDLRADEIVVREDGEVREVVDLQLVDLLRASPVPDPAVPPSPTEPPASPAPPRRPGELAAVVFVIDMPGLYFGNSRRFTEALLEMERRTRTLEIPHAIYLISEGGRLHELSPLTTDEGRLVEAAASARSRPSSRGRGRDLTDFQENLTGALDAMSGDRDMGASGVAASRRDAQARERLRGIRTLRTLDRIAGALQARSGRTALVWVSSGIDLASYTPLRRRPGSIGTDSELRDSESWRYQQTDERVRLEEALHETANSANVSFYSVDPTGLWELVGFGGQRAGSTADVRGASLRRVASATGGRSYIAWSDLDAVLADIQEDRGASTC